MAPSLALSSHKKSVFAQEQFCLCISDLAKNLNSDILCISVYVFLNRNLYISVYVFQESSILCISVYVFTATRIKYCWLVDARRK